jgi:predicted PurR-regulated permease PerM
MTTAAHPSPASSSRRTRRLSFSALLTLVVIGIGLCALIAAPFLSALTWAFALAVIAGPFHQWLERWLRRPSIAAGLSVLIVTLLLLIPTLIIGWQVGLQASSGLSQIQTYLNEGSLRELIGKVPGGLRVYDMVVSDKSGASTLVPAVQEQASIWVASAAAALFQIVVALFALFFLLRDHAAVVRTFRSYMPMSRSEADYFFERISTMTYATLYGSGVTAVLQGVLGGLMFAFMGIPGALLWGLVMALLSLIPSSGAFVIWIPTAIVLAVQGSWGRAAVLAAWGALVVGTIDNVVYPWLVGKEVRLHTLVVFLAVVGGLIVFGAAGLVLGPVTAVATIALLDIVRRRSGTATDR